MKEQTRNITYGRTTVQWDINRQGWALPGRKLTKNRESAKRAAKIINGITESKK